MREELRNVWDKLHFSQVGFFRQRIFYLNLKQLNFDLISFQYRNNATNLSHATSNNTQRRFALRMKMKSKNLTIITIR